jgi:DNA-binding transcriptional MocR family regulator
VSRDLLRDTAIDLQAKGLLVFMLDKPDNWMVRPRELAKELRVSKNTVYRVLEKLIGSHYVRRTDLRRRKPDGTFEQASLYDVFENREDAELWPAEKIPF